MPNKDPKKRLAQARAWVLKHKFHLREEDYKLAFLRQEGRCAICGEQETVVDGEKKPRRLSIDHNHSTGALRELLCARCNLALGYARESPEILEEMARYLRKHQLIRVAYDL